MIFTIWTLAAFCISHLLSFIKIVFAFEDYDTYYFTWSTIRYSTVDLYRASCLSYHYCLSWIFLKSLGVMSSSLWMVNFSFAGLGFNHKGFLIRVFEERARELLFLFSLLICFSIYSFPLPLLLMKLIQTPPSGLPTSPPQVTPYATYNPNPHHHLHLIIASVISMTTNFY